MLKSKSVVACAVILAGALGLASIAKADVQHRNYVTFSAPFALPGVSLPAGTYIFEVIAPGSLDVVTVRSRDRSQITYNRV